MRVNTWEKSEQRSAGYMVQVNKTEAIQIAHTLLDQIIINSCNAGRFEFTTEKGEYFSIAVVDNK